MLLRDLTPLDNQQLSIPSYPPLWTKPPASIAHPSEDIPINDFCAKSLLDYEVSTPDRLLLWFSFPNRSFRAIGRIGIRHLQRVSGRDT
jgi:hypothetical protein